MSYSGQSSENRIITKGERALDTTLFQPLILCMRNEELARIIEQKFII